MSTTSFSTKVFSSMGIGAKPSPKEDERTAAAWGEVFARLFFGQFGSDLGAVLRARRIHLIVVRQDQSGFPLPRFAIWEGDTRTIRLFQQPLQEHESGGEIALRRACLHELFHACVSDQYAGLSLRLPAPALSHKQEEIAAHAFAAFTLRNFCLTLQGSLLNFE